VNAVILAPDSAEVVADMGVLKDITIIKSPEYNVQLFVTKSDFPDLAALKKGQLQDVKSNRLYSEIVEENEDGFIYKNKIDENTINYGFRYLFQKDGEDYVFQQGLSGIFSLEEVENMYKSVQQ